MSRDRVLALDPGARCGFAYADGPNPIPLVENSGTWSLVRRGDNWGARWVRLEERMEAVAPTRVVYELVRGHKGVEAAHSYGGFIATITRYCEVASIPYDSIPVATVKKHATGKGNARKAQMVEAARRQFGQVEDDNEADALWILDAYLTGVGR